MELSTSLFRSVQVRASGAIAIEDPQTLFELTGSALQPSQLLLRVHAVALHPGEAQQASAPPAAAYTPCTNCVGRVVAAGAGPLTSLTGAPLQVGAFVYALRTRSGACASMALCDAAACAALPFDAGALGAAQRRARLLAIAPLPTPHFAACLALQALGLRAQQQQPPPQPQPSLLVLGADCSFAGHAAAALASSWGCRVLATAGCAEGCALLVQQRLCSEGGALRHDGEQAGVQAGVARACGSAGVERVLELGAVPQGLALGVAALARQGAVAVLREPSLDHTTPAPAALDCSALAARGGTVQGVALEGASPEQLRQCALAFEAVLLQVHLGQRPALPLLVVEGLDAAPGAFGAAAASTPLSGAVVVDCWQ